MVSAAAALFASGVARMSMMHGSLWKFLGNFANFLLQQSHGIECTRRASLTLADFDIIRRIGDGSFSEVMHVRHKKSGTDYALKMVDKHLIVRHKMVGHIKQVGR